MTKPPLSTLPPTTMHPDPNDPVARALAQNPEVPRIAAAAAAPPPVEEIEPTQDWLLVRSKQLINDAGGDEESKILLPSGVSNIDDSSQLVEILKVGPGRYSVNAGKHEPMPYAPGDRVWHTGRGATTFPGWDKVGLLLLPAREVLAKCLSAPIAKIVEGSPELEESENGEVEAVPAGDGFVVHPHA